APVCTCKCPTDKRAPKSAAKPRSRVGYFWLNLTGAAATRHAGSGIALTRRRLLTSHQTPPGLDLADFLAENVA
ncbi:MAG: hypothetical protein ABF308_10965, partial [Phaeobacter gallaeciensis]